MIHCQRTHAIQLYSVHPLNIAALAAQGGFEAVELCQPYKYSTDDLLTLLQDDSRTEPLELACLGMYVAQTDDPSALGFMGYAAVPGFEKQFREDFQTTLKYAKALNCRNINIFTGIPHYAFIPQAQIARETAPRRDESKAKSTGQSLDEEAVSGGAAPGGESGVVKQNNQSAGSGDAATSGADDEVLPSPTSLAVTEEHPVPCFSLPPPTASGMPNSVRTEIAAAAQAILEGRFYGSKQLISKQLDVTSLVCPVPQRLSKSFNLAQADTLYLGPGITIDCAGVFLKNLSRAVNQANLARLENPTDEGKEITVTAENASYFLDQLATATLFSNLKWALEQIQADPELAGQVSLLLEPVSDVPGYFMDSVHKAIKFIAAFANPAPEGSNYLPVALLFDAYHMQRLHGNLGELLECVLPLVRHIQVASVPRRREPDRGEVNFMYLLKRIDKLGYEGWVGLEYAPTLGKTKVGLKPWFSQYQRKRQSSAGVLFCARGKQGKPYVLLGKSHKRGHEWGLFWGRPDSADPDVAYTAAREATEESLGVVATQDLLYRALQDPKYHFKFPWLGLYVVSLGELGGRERDSLVQAYDRERQKKTLSSCEREMLEIDWFDARDIFASLVLKKKSNLPKLKEFFKRELARGMEELPQFRAFCERGALPIAPLQELVASSSDAISVRNWHSAPP